MISKCPFCDRELSIENFSSIYLEFIQECVQPDHEFWFIVTSNNWYIHHIETDLFINQTKLTLNEAKRPGNLMEFSFISPQEGGRILKKVIKLKGFV